MHRSYIGVGANLGDAAENVRRGVVALARVGTVLCASPLYRTKPWGVSGQPDYVNAVALLATPLEPRALLDALKALEAELGRTPGVRWGPRTIDFDVLTFDDGRVEEPGLTIPHPRMRERAFVLVPLAEIDPSFAGLRDALPSAELAGVTRLE